MKTDNPKTSKNNLYSGIVWIVSSFAFLIYATMVFFNSSVPGVEDLIKFLSSIDGVYLYLAAFIATSIEGLYVIGNFFPGSSTVIILVLISQSVNLNIFIMTLIAIFIGWVLAGAINIFLATHYHLRFTKLEIKSDYKVKNNYLTTWFPAFRSNYEVSQISEGARPLNVFISSIKVKLFTCIMMGIGALIVPFFIDVQNISNEEGILSLIVVSIICFIVGYKKIK